MWGIIEQVFPYAIAYTVPMLLTALGAFIVKEVELLI